MAKCVFLGGAQDFPQIETITVSGTWASTETATITVGEKKVVFTCGGSETTSTVAAGLQALAAASEAQEFREITWTVNSNVITGTSPSGVPVSISVADTAASGSIGTTTTQAATGPNHWDNNDNWSGGAVPTTSDEVFIEDRNVKIRYGLPSALTLAKVRHIAGEVGLPDRNSSGYPEYRTKRASVTCTDVQFGMQPGSGPALARWNLESSNAVVAVFGTLARSDGATVDLLMNHSSSSVAVISGSVAVAPSLADTSTVGTIRVGNSGAMTIGAGVTLTNLYTSGNTLAQNAITTAYCDAGTLTLSGSGTVGTLNVRDGTCVHKTSGTITQANVGPGNLDCSHDLRARTITDLTLKKNGTFLDPYNVITVTNGIVLDSTADRLTAA